MNGNLLTALFMVVVLGLGIVMGPKRHWGSVLSRVWDYPLVLGLGLLMFFMLIGAFAA